MKKSFLIFIILLLVLPGCAVSSYKRGTSDISRGDKLPVDFVKEGTQNPEVVDNYINEIRKDGELLATFLKHPTQVKDFTYYNNEKGEFDSHRMTQQFRVTVYLEPEIHEIQLCQNGKVIREIEVDPVKTKEIRYNTSGYDAFMSRGGWILTIPAMIIYYPVLKIMEFFGFKM